MSYSAELRQQIEDLALKLVVGEPGIGMAASDWIPALEHIRNRAQQERAERVAAAATALMEGIERSGADRVAVELQDGIGCLQAALEVEQQQAAPAELGPAQDPELLSDFVLESREHLAAIESQVLTIERDPLNAEALNSVFRGFHTIKGLAGFLELWEVQKLAHEVETVLDRARNLQLTITPPAIDVILQGADYLRRWLAHVEAELRNQSSEAPPRDESLLDRIRSLTSGQSRPETAPEALVTAGSRQDPATVPGEPGPRATPQFAPSPEIASMAAAVDSEEATPPTATSEAPGVEAPKEAPPAEAAKPEETPSGPAAPAAAAAAPRHETMAVKVDTGKLDYLVDMAGEMVIAESLVRHDPELAALKSQKLQRKIAQLTRITAELQKTAMAMRLVPIGPLFRRMARLVRDLSRQFGKRVEMETQGDEIELDRNIVEELSDPLMHMVRNAMDHGIETPKERQEKGKDPSARLLLKAQHQAGQVVIEIADDGRGLDRNKIRAKAIDKGLISAADELSENEIHNLIFMPGFSTAAQVTNVSGRGVGMDVVRRHIEKLRGRIEIRSNPGCGSAFFLKLPLTLAIIDGLVVGVGQERYIVPLFAVREMFRPTQETIWTVQQRAEMALVRGGLLPVLRLYRRFGVTPRSEDPMKSVLVVAEVEGQRFCLLVDDLIGKQEVVIKSLGEMFQQVAGIAGGAIMGDGRVGLILDLDRLFKDKSGESSH